MGIPKGTHHIYLYLHLAVMLMISSESVRELPRLKLTVMTDIKLLLKEFERYAYGQSKHTAFTELLDWTLLPFKKFNIEEEQNNALEAYQTTLKSLN